MRAGSTHKTSLGSGAYRWSAQVQTVPTTQTGTGAPVTTWIDAQRIRVHVEATAEAGSKVNDGTLQQQAVAWFKVTTRKITSIDPSSRLVLSGAPFDGLTVYIYETQYTLKETIWVCVQRAN